MAKVNVKTNVKEVKKVVVDKVKVPEFTLTLSLEEALILLCLTGNVAGSKESKVKDANGAIYDALYEKLKSFPSFFEEQAFSIVQNVDSELERCIEAHQKRA